MNNICIAGTIGNSEVRYLNNGDPVLQFSVADSQGKDKPTIWWNCTLWGKRAESLGNFVQKGGKVTVTGTVVEEHYTDKSGQEKKAMKVKPVTSTAIDSPIGTPSASSAASAARLGRCRRRPRISKRS